MLKTRTLRLAEPWPYGADRRHHGHGRASTKAGTVRIWSDHDRLTAVQKVAGDWGSSHGVTIQVVEKNFGNIRDDLATSTLRRRPTSSSARTTGRVSSRPTASSPALPEQGDAGAVPEVRADAFSYGTAVKKLFGIPVALENVGLVVNTKLAKVPTTFAQLESEALAFKKKSSQNLAIAVPQGANGDAYHMYPFFSGLGGYVFGTNGAGNLDPSNIGVANTKFIRNAEPDHEVEQGRPDQLEGRLRPPAKPGLPQGAGRLLDPPSGGKLQTLAVERHQVQDHPDAEDRERAFGAVPGRPGLPGHEVRCDARRRQRFPVTWSATTWRRRPLRSPLAAANGRFPANTDGRQARQRPEFLKPVRQGQRRRRARARPTHSADEARVGPEARPARG